MNKNITIKPWYINFRALAYYIYRPLRFQKSLRSIGFIVCLLSCAVATAQNKLQKELSAEQIKVISINGDQFFNISVSTSKKDKISISSILDGEYQNDFQLVVKEENNKLNLSLAYLSLIDIPDNKRNAHKVIAAMLYLEIPEHLSLNIISDIGHVKLDGIFNSLSIELLQGQCSIKGESKSAIINTLDGDINIITNSAIVEAKSNHGKVVLDHFDNKDAIWKLTSINGNITVAKPN
ncbi:DUF4097 family beta strand repeat-containing protein [Winogradskyella eximia]|uniref:hypothetical protein n=1 Tax=Winogradskyella eximia TaxID=262006 RepID=UPI000E26519B|nr:hypothetical protein [Winogradskyella eximia]